MQTAHKRDAVLNEKFYFRKNVFTSRTPTGNAQPKPESVEDEDAYELMTLNEIVNGKVSSQPEKSVDVAVANSVHFRRMDSLALCL